jgi:hypothetical protein
LVFDQLKISNGFGGKILNQFEMFTENFAIARTLREEIPKSSKHKRAFQ